MIPLKVYYCYNLVSSDTGGRNRTTVHCGPYELSAYEFNSVNGTALCWAHPSCVLKYEKKEIVPGGQPLDPLKPLAPGLTIPGYSGKVTIEDYVVSAHSAGGEFMTLPVQRISPLSVIF